MKILVADHSDALLVRFTASLKSLGYNDVVLAANEQQMLDLFKSEHPDLLMLDADPNGINGFDLAKKIRALTSEEDWIPIIFLCDTINDENMMKSMEAEGDDFLAKSCNAITLAAKIKAMQRFTTMRKKLTEKTQRLNALSSADLLTGVYNRLQFERAIKEKVSHARRYKKMLALLLIDLDNFQVVNDNFGNAIGDFLLKEVADRIQQCLRVEDVVARIGGDEFAVIVTDITDSNVIGDIAQKIIDAISPSYNLADNTIVISSSVGIACYNPHMVTPFDQEALVQHADIAMLQAKAMGHNTYQYFTDELHVRHKQQANLATELRYALEKNEFSLSYQPILNLQTKKMLTMEALLFWKHPRLGLMLPNVFIPVAEELGLVENISQWVLKSIGEQSAKWFAGGYEPIVISTNLSMRLLLQKNFPAVITAILRDTNMPARLLELEFTEASAFIYSNRLEEILKTVHEHGISIAIDNFGMGYSSLDHLKRLPIDTIKINKTLLQDVGIDPGNTVAMKSMIALSQSLGLTVIAQGVESEKQVNFLLENNCVLGQGFYLSKPLSSDEMTSFLEEQKTST